MTMRRLLTILGLVGATCFPFGIQLYFENARTSSSERNRVKSNVELREMLRKILSENELDSPMLRALIRDCLKEFSTGYLWRVEERREWIVFRNTGKDQIPFTFDDDWLVCWPEEGLIRSGMGSENLRRVLYSGEQVVSTSHTLTLGDVPYGVEFEY